MADEIERKFLPRDGSWREVAGEGVRCVQGYLSLENDVTTEVREEGSGGYITITARPAQSPLSAFEVAIPSEDAAQIRALEGTLVVRARIKGDFGYLTIKGVRSGISCPEYEYEIGIELAQELLHLCRLPLIEKVRYCIPFHGLTWEVDEFSGANDGLVVAEVELASETQEVPLPAWVGEEVSRDKRYANVNLVKTPYNGWA